MIIPFSNFRCSYQFQKENGDISFFFTWNSFGSTKKLGPKIFFLLLKGGFVVLLQRISHLVMAFCWRKSCFLDELASCLERFEQCLVCNWRYFRPDPSAFLAMYGS